MQKRRRQFYIPNTDFWHWDRLTDTFLKVQLDRVRESISQTESALSVCDEQVSELYKLAFTEYRKGTPRLRQTIEMMYAEIKVERKRLHEIQDRLVQEGDRIKSELHGRKINSDRRLPA